MASKVDWEAIQLEYETTNKTFAALSKQFDVPVTTIKSRRKKGNWVRRKDVVDVSELEQSNEINESHSLTPQQARFVLEYVTDLNAAQAAIRAGYSEESAAQAGYKLVHNSSVQKAIQEQMDARSRRTLITADRVIAELAKLAFSNSKSLYKSDGSIIPVHELPDDVAATISEIKHRVLKEKDGDETIASDEFTYKLIDKKGSLELLAKHLRLLTDKVEVVSSYEEDLEALAEGL